MDITPNLSPYFFQVNDDADDPVRFRLRPLTQPQISELSRTYEYDERLEQPGPTMHTFYRAACLGLDGGREIEGLTLNGKPAKWPRDREHIPYAMMIKAGVELYSQAFGSDAGESEKNS